MVHESESMKKLHNRNIFEEIKKQVTQIQGTTLGSKKDMERERQKEHEKLLRQIFQKMVSCRLRLFCEIKRVICVFESLGDVVETENSVENVVILT